MSKVINLTCNCCGSDAGNYQQWHNRDNGFGVCKRCVNMGSNADMLSNCGKPDVHRPRRDDEPAEPAQ